MKWKYKTDREIIESLKVCSIAFMFALLVTWLWIIAFN